MKFLDALKLALANKPKNSKFVVGGTKETKRLMSQNQDKHNVESTGGTRDIRATIKGTIGKRDI